MHKAVHYFWPYYCLQIYATIILTVYALCKMMVIHLQSLSYILCINSANLGTPELPPQDAGPGYHLADSNDLRQVTILSKNDWERIQQQLNRKQIEEARLRKIREEREERKNKSKEVVQHWGNTIAVSLMVFS